MSPQFTDEIETLIVVTSRLIGVMNSEVEMLRAMRVGDIDSLQREKHDLTILYEERVRALAAQPQALEAIEPALRGELSELAQRFDTALSENARALLAVRESHDRLLKAIVDAVASNRARERGYTPGGGLDRPGHRGGADTLSLSLDRRL
ncbi:MAG: hypothetical protein ACI9MJ_000027 [Alphaproteobacteria bacterium]|jgi:hypothetical protein